MDRLPGVKIQIKHEFKSPKILEDYVKRSQREKLKIQYYDHELKLIDRRLLKPIDKAYTKRSWELFVDILVRICRDDLFSVYKDRLFYTSQKIVFKDYLADNKDGTYK